MAKGLSLGARAVKHIITHSVESDPDSEAMLHK